MCIFDYDDSSPPDGKFLLYTHTSHVAVHVLPEIDKIVITTEIMVNAAISRYFHGRYNLCRA